MCMVCRSSVVITLAVAAACFAGDVNTPPPGDPIPITRLRSEPYSFTAYSGFDQSARLIIRDPMTWQAAWLKTFRGTSPIPPAPEIDFSQEMVVLVALGAHSTGGYSILIEGATATDGGASIVVHSVSPGSRCITTQAFTQPVDIARMARRDGTITFVERNDVFQCE